MAPPCPAAMQARAKPWVFRKRAAQIGAHHRIPLIGPQIQQAGPGLDAGIVHQHIRHRPRPVRNCRMQGANGGLIACVAFPAARPAAHGGHLRLQRPHGRIGTQMGEGHILPGPGQGQNHDAARWRKPPP